MEDKKQDNKTGIFITEENCSINSSEQFVIVDFGAAIVGVENSSKETVEVNKIKESFPSNKREEKISWESPVNKTNDHQQKQDEESLRRLYLFFNYLEEENKKRGKLFENLLNKNPLNIEYTKSPDGIKSIKIPIKIYNDFNSLPEKKESAIKVGAVAFGGRAGTILSQIINLKAKDNKEVVNDKVNLLVKGLGATDEAERQKKEGYKKKITSVLVLPLSPFLAGYKKYQEYKESKELAKKDKDNKIEYLKVQENSNRFNFTSYEFNGLLHCDVSYVGVKKKTEQNVEKSVEYGTSTILLEGSLKKKFLEIENNYKDKDAEKKLAQLNLLGSYFVSSGKDDAVGDKDQIPQLNLENPKGKQKIKFSVSVSQTKDGKIALVSYNIDKDILAEIKAGEKAMNKIEKYFFVKLPSPEASYVKCDISRNKEGELLIKPDLTMVYDKNLFASSEKTAVDKMNAFLAGCKFQIASSVEREVKKEGEAVTTVEKVTYSKANNATYPLQTKIKLTGENLLEKLSKSSKKPDTQQKQ